MKGGSTDGNRYIDKALAQARSASLPTPRPPSTISSSTRPASRCSQVEHGRRALAQASAAFFGHPERKLAATGITGTNGKTTTAFLD